MTRKKLQLQVEHVQETWFWRKQIQNKNRNQPSIVDLHILYLDTDLCISRLGEELQVFTKNEQWTGKQGQWKRKVTLDILVYIYIFTLV